LLRPPSSASRGPAGRLFLKIPLPESLDRFLNAFRTHRTAYIVFLIVVGAAATGIALWLPNWYRAETTLLPPPENNDAFGAVTSMIQSSALNQLGLVTTSTSSDIFAEILRSRTLNEAAIDSFHLASIYKLKGADKTLKEFRVHLGVSVGHSGVLVLAFEDRDPQRAADVANFLTSELDRFNREALNTRAKRTRLFLEGRLTDTQARLTEAQQALSEYEREHKVLAGADQVAVEGAASVIAQKMNLEVRRSYVAEYSGESSPQVRELDAQIAAVDREITRLPTLKMEGGRLALEAEIQSKLFTLISSQYEEARIEEARDTPTVTVLDAARVPDYKSRPKRSIIILVSVLAALGLCALRTLLEMRTAPRT
jgi:uncharacterized protein involved in exopolysaccharide biosynthesis